MDYNIAGLINQVNIDHKFIDVNVVCVEDLIIRIILLQHYVWVLVYGFFMHKVSVKCAGPVGLFTCFLCFQQYKGNKEFMSMNCSIINHYKVKWEILVLVIIEIIICTFGLIVQIKYIIDMPICNIINVDFIFLYLKHLLVLEHLVELK